MVRIPYKPLSERMIEEPFWLGMITVAVVMGCIGVVFCIKKHFAEKIEKFFAEEIEKSKYGMCFYILVVYFNTLMVLWPMLDQRKTSLVIFL